MIRFRVGLKRPLESVWVGLEIPVCPTSVGAVVTIEIKENINFQKYIAIRIKILYV